jgi:hypothetical protein
MLLSSFSSLDPVNSVSSIHIISLRYPALEYFYPKTIALTRYKCYSGFQTIPFSRFGAALAQLASLSLGSPRRRFINIAKLIQFCQQEIDGIFESCEICPT